ncbi:MAG: hypothetical protein J0M04_17975 [Verrucomicrobia bacterium]|nr:hypothetical protein [Verrucomicrobiota bacterium]
MKSIRTIAARLAAAVIVASLSVSCVSTQNTPISAADRAAMKGKTFTVTSRRMPSHAVFKQSAMGAAMLGGAVGGAIAGTIAEAEGKTQIQRHNIANPNDTLSREVAKALAARTGARQVAPRGTTDPTDPAKVAAANQHADYVLDCFVTGWTGIYYPFSLGRYNLIVAAKMQLMESSTGRVVAEGYQVYQGNDRANAPDYDGIYANGAAFLKAETAKGLGGAIGNFSNKF